jgi:molybdopterin-containing oxidoreductase family iron-sulfur binding subunit
MSNTAFAPKTVAVQASAIAGVTPSPRGQGLDVVFLPDPSVYDGRFANNAWLQELPKSLTKLTWDNAALLSPATADRLKVVSGSVVELKQGNNSIQIPVWINPAIPPTH